MTIAEFKAWLEGFEAAMSGPPNAEQWQAIKAKIETVHDAGPQPSFIPVWPETPRFDPTVTGPRAVPFKCDAIGETPAWIREAH